MESALPILYSYRRCPYAMRARMALRYSGIAVEIREISFKAKPRHMLSVSPKATVPVLVLPCGKVIDESLDIMRWALAQHDTEDWLLAGNAELSEAAAALIAGNDGEFKAALDRYKYAIRFPERPASAYRAECEVFLRELERCLQKNTYLLGQHCSFADVAIFPFVRQFASVDAAWFERSSYVALHRWLATFILSELFRGVMQKYPLWEGERV